MSRKKRVKGRKKRREMSSRYKMDANETQAVERLEKVARAIRNGANPALVFFYTFGQGVDSAYMLPSFFGPGFEGSDVNSVFGAVHYWLTLVLTAPCPCGKDKCYAECCLPPYEFYEHHDRCVLEATGCAHADTSANCPICGKTVPEIFGDDPFAKPREFRPYPDSGTCEACGASLLFVPRVYGFPLQLWGQAADSAAVCKCGIGYLIEDEAKVVEDEDA